MAKLTKVQIEVISGTNMPMTDTVFDASKFDFKSMGLVAAPADPFVVCMQGSQVLFKTKAITDAVNPVWNHKETRELDRSKGDLKFVVFDADEGDVLETIVKRESENDWIGEVTVPLRSVAQSFSLVPPTAPPPGAKSTKKAQKKKIGKDECSLKLKIVVEESGCCGGCSVM
eukprot:CAMPEP_0171108468 /NCGR_PEP_ID=MMETSP0766_2-20121228/69008_1 /TAXON_ID=439317 /ORGANISM="Gambierdiscus australes, Strain CAWD 149" /LENGTH=171 /DNA_ID=CAMNT_0011570011 /DNA_START=62 /DNA_END=577 /DNA_ORIENTATION=+